MAPHHPEDEAGRDAQSTSWSAVNYLMRAGHSWSGRERNSCYFNLGGGRFANMSFVSGVGYVDDGRGVAPVDWDGDGDLDLWMNLRNSPKVRYFRNDYDGDNHFIAVKAIGTACNRDAIGARIEAKLADGSIVMGTVRANVNYTVQGTKWVHLGLGPETRIETLTVRWPGGEPAVYRNLRVDRRYVIEQGGGAPQPVPVGAVADLAPAHFDVPFRSQKASVPIGVPMPVPPTLGFTDFKGNRVELGDFAGSPVLINFWASWCTSCMTEFADFKDHENLIEQSGLRIMAVSVDLPEVHEAAERVTSRFGFWFPAGRVDVETAPITRFLDVLKDSVFDKYDALPLPSSLLIDGRGRLARIYVGPCESEELLADVRSLQDASNDIERLYAASPFQTGYWSQPEAWIESAMGNQLLGMNEFFAAAGHLDLLGFYAEALATHMNERERPGRALQKALVALRRAAVLVKDEDPKRAASIYRSMVQADGDNTTALFGLTGALLASGDPATRDEAAAAFDRALDLVGEPETADDWYAFGVTYYELGKYIDAVPYLERAVVEMPNRADVRRQLGKTLDRAGRPDEAVVHYEKVIELSPTPRSIDEHANLAKAYLRLQKWAEAIPHLEAVLAQDPTRHLDRSVLGRALAYVGRNSEALEHLEHALPNLDPNPSSEYLLGMVRAKAGRLQDAVECFERAVRIKPDYRDAVIKLTQAYGQLGQGSRIAPTFTAYLQRATEDRPTMLHMERLFLNASRPGLAINVYRDVLRVAPSADFVAHRLSWMLATSPSAADRDGKEAVRLAEDLVRRVGRNALLLDGLAAAYAETGRFKEAERTANEAVNAARQSQPNLAQEIAGRAQLYAQGRPFRLQ